jgi:hypothetical protein
MSQIVKIPTSELTPSQDDVLEQQGVPRGTPVRPDIENICQRALSLLDETAATVAVTAPISRSEFEVVFTGEGNNEVDTPVGEIIEQAEHLMLFAVTIGKTTSNAIDTLFQSSDYALGCMLDAAASITADKAAAHVEQSFSQSLAADGWNDSLGAALRYSPGYCGWHISGQKKLFEYLEPEQIRLTLRPSYLMEPLKSVSGVVLAGPREMHDFQPYFPSCATCKTQSCRERIRALFAE